jgi:putative hemolysin
MHLTSTRLESGTRGAVSRGSSNGIVNSEMKRGDFCSAVGDGATLLPRHSLTRQLGCVVVGGEELEEWEEWEDGAEASIQFNLARPLPY